MWDGHLEQISDTQFLLPRSYKKGMRVDGMIFADRKLIDSIKTDRAPEQVANVAFLPGIVNYSYAMPDIHWGYGFPVGGVAATDSDKGGVISPGGVGFDINCGVRLLRTNLTYSDIETSIDALVTRLYNEIPAGLGSKGNIKLTRHEARKLVREGAAWAVEKGMGVSEDLEYCEEQGAMAGADPDAVSERAYTRGSTQEGTLGSGNHFIEIGFVSEIFDTAAAQVYGVFPQQVVVMIHSGSRGFGYQVCEEYARLMVKSLYKYSIQIPDRQLACAPLDSPEAKRYVGAMKAAANYAWCNRQILMYLVRKTFSHFFSKSWQSLGMSLVYDVSHNIAKFEKHPVEGKRKLLCVHRKGATRAFGPGHPELPGYYRSTGQPVIIPGDMGRISYLLKGTVRGQSLSFSSACHGAGRVKSRHEALKTVDVSALLKRLKIQKISVRAVGKKTLIEEAPEVYKDVTDVVQVIHKAGIAEKVCTFKPVGVIKG